MLVTACQAISVSMSTSSSATSQNIQLDPGSSLRDFAVVSNDDIFRDTTVKGGSMMSQTVSGGGKSFSTNAVGPDLKSTQIATPEGITGSVSAGSETLFAPSDEEFLSNNPELAVDISHLSVTGKPIIISGGVYPAGGVDLTEPYYIDPAQTFKFTTYSGASMPSPSDESFGWWQNWQMVRNSISKGESAWNAAAGKPIFDGMILADGYQAGGAPDGMNAIYPTGSFAIGSNLMQTRTVYNSQTRKVLDVDIGINLKYTPNLYQSQSIMDTVMLHEFGHALGIRHNPYSSTTVMRPLFDYSQAGLSSDDKAIVKAKYNN